MEEEKNFFIKYPGFKRLYECFIELAITDTQRDAIEQIMKNGEYNGFKLNSMLSNKKYNEEAERNRRINLAEIALFDEGLFRKLANNGLNVFHGTKLDALETILSEGMLSSSELNEKEIQLKTGEEHDVNGVSRYKVEKRKFISLTDDFSIAASYAGFIYEEQMEYFIKYIGRSIKSNEGVPIIICFNGNDIEQKYNESIAYVESMYNEIGVTTSIDPSNIKCLITSYDNIETVRAIASKYGIDVFGYDFNNKFEERGAIHKKGKFYISGRDDVSVDEQKFESYKDMIKEQLKESNSNVHRKKLLEEEVSEAIAEDIEMDIVFDLIEQYNNEGHYTPVSADDFIAQYNLNEKVAQRLATEINERLENYTQSKKSKNENSTPYIVDEPEKETQEISTQKLGKETVDVQKDVKRMDNVERQLNGHMQEQARAQGKIEKEHNNKVGKGDD